MFFIIFYFIFLLLIQQPCYSQSNIERNIVYRGGFSNSRNIFESTGKGTVAFLGGSITEMEGYRPMICDFLQERFPETTFNFINAGIASTCSTTGVFRLNPDLLTKGKVDLFFVEFAVNDDQDAHHSVKQSIRGMEGIIRHIRKSNPDVDIVIRKF